MHTTATALPLTPGEALLLLNPGRLRPSQALKVSLIALVVQRILAIETETVPRRFGRPRRVAHLRLGTVPAEGLAQPATALVEIVRATNGGTMRDFVTRAQAAYGKDLAGFVGRVLAPSLIARGLVEIRPSKFLGLFTIRRRVRTEAGEAERARLLAAMERAREVPRFLTSDPAQAAAIASSLGGLILLVDELKPHYKALSDALRLAGTDAVDAADALNMDGFGGDFDLGSFDGAAFDVLESSISAMDADFHATSGGDSDSGGGSGHH